MNKFLLPLFVLFFSYAATTSAQTDAIITVAGTTAGGYLGDGGAAVNCQLHWPEAVALDDSGNLYIADADNNVIRKVYGRFGTITTFAGTGLEAGTGLGGFSGDGGPATAATLNYPSGIAIDPTGNVYIADQRNNRIRKVDPTTGVITTVAGSGSIGFIGDGGAATSAALYHPCRIALDAANNLYIADSGNNRIRKVDAATGNINTIAGNGTQGNSGDGGLAIMAALYEPIDMAVDASGNVFIADYVNNRIRKVDGSGNISTYAGIGIPGFSGDSAQATAANLYEPSGITVDPAGNIYFSDRANNRVRKIDPTGIITTIAGSTNVGAYGGDDSLATKAKLWSPEGLTVDQWGEIYVADKANNRVRLISGTLNVNKVSPPSAVNIYPNPSHGNFVVRISSAVSEDVRITITNVTGGTIKTLQTTTNSSTPVSFDAPPGMYFLSAATAGGVLNEKIVVR